MGDSNHAGGGWGVEEMTQETAKLQASPYDILPPINAMINYMIGLQKQPANGQLFLRAQTAVSLLPNRQLKLYHTAFLSC